MVSYNTKVVLVGFPHCTLTKWSFLDRRNPVDLQNVCYYKLYKQPEFLLYLATLDYASYVKCNKIKIQK